MASAEYPDRLVGILRDTMTSLVRRDGPDLSARQMAVFLTVYLSDGPHTVRGLAQWLNVSKPAITRALDRLGELDIARRKLDPMDRRSVHVQRTIRGAELLQEVRDTMAQAEKQTMDWIHGGTDPNGPNPPQTMAAFNPRG
ncbi:MarR family transcriptional regulator [Rhodovarius crocodyli]|uniref:MarR family transcriptional regulator n=1 Tax=Rhodovarius crocodyli TaxID=1979269 RepID=A0A437MPD7_9PROT|nr:MarR family transcriptional regulator [Rhodovarius crocodyli]RVT99498.1 MarR family transcriptional regulator [Rhodovarius crocodyli]